MKKPTIGITMGDPSGIGPELIIKVLSQEATFKSCNPFVIGDPTVMREASGVVGRELHISVIGDISEATFSYSRLDVLRPEGVDVQKIRWGRLDPAMGKAAALCLEKACHMALEKKLDGIVSAPLNKEAFHRAGYRYLDELEFMREITHSPEASIMGVMDSIWTVAVTSHIPFRDIADSIKKDRVLKHIHLMDRTLKRVGFADPRIAVAALNVHGGEGGLIGREEIEEIEPAIEAAKKVNIKVQGPFPADTVFARALSGEFNGVVCMYHDQANIARKLQPRRKGATIFMGLPVICGTTAHGTAFDIAGKGIADPGSLQDALRYTGFLSS
jgi:4-hydroxythreonine-4-phosphate dehydrogenase